MMATSMTMNRYTRWPRSLVDRGARLLRPGQARGNRAAQCHSRGWWASGPPRSWRKWSRATRPSALASRQARRALCRRRRALKKGRRWRGSGRRCRLAAERRKVRSPRRPNRSSPAGGVRQYQAYLKEGFVRRVGAQRPTRRARRRPCGIRTAKAESSMSADKRNGLPAGDDGLITASANTVQDQVPLPPGRIFELAQRRGA